jgi:hypothetical protein
MTASSAEKRSKFEWYFRYECNHAGAPRDRRKKDLSPSKRRNRIPPIKCGCHARIRAYQLAGSDTVAITYHWEHNGHCMSLHFIVVFFSMFSVDPKGITDMKTSRSPDEVRVWLDGPVTCTPKVIPPKRQKRELEEDGTLEDQRAQKRRLIEKIREDIVEMGRADYWNLTDASLDRISAASLTQLLSAANDLWQLLEYTLLVRPDAY